MEQNMVISTVLRLQDQMSGGLVQAAKNTKGVTDEMVKATSQVVAFQNKAETAIQTVTSKFAKWGAQTAGKVAALAGKMGLTEAMDLEGYRIQLEMATKDTVRAGEVMQYAVKLANATPFESGALAAAASQLETLGLKTERWLPLLGDAAAGTNRSIEQVQGGFVKAVTTGNFDGLKDTLSITKEMVQDFAKQKFGKNFLDSQGAVTDMNLLQNALEGLLTQRFGGGMDKLSQTTKGLWSTITGATKSALAKMMGMSDDGTVRAGSALDFVKGKAAALAAKLQQWQADGTIDRLSKQLADGLGWAVAKAGQAFDWVRAHGDTIIAVLQQVGAAFAVYKVLQFASGVGQAISTFASFAKTVGLFALQNPIVLALGAAVAVGVLLWQNWDWIKTNAQMLWEKITIVFGGIRDAIAGAFLTVLEAAKSVQEFFSNVFAIAIDTVKGAFDRIKGAVGGLIDKVKEFLGMDTHKEIGVTTYTETADGRVSGGWSGSGGAGGNDGQPGRSGGPAAVGVSYPRGGPTRAGERVGEIMNLTGGTQIVPRDIPVSMTGGNRVAVSVTVQGNVIGNRQYADEMGGVIAQKVISALGNT